MYAATEYVMSKIMNYSVALVLMLTVATLADEPKRDTAKIAETAVDSATISPNVESSEIVYAYYFHGDVRCATCIKLENYSHEALTTGFEKELGDSTIIWQMVNYDKDINKHFIEDFQLYTKALVLVRHKDGKVTAWKNLDKIWNLVGNKEDYIKYVQSETKQFLEGKTTDE